ncbi:class I SAM-dependent methyltransferase [Shinella sp.]|uniref:class I SAM-dependent methyltransferase n=1 Tax=Shinella sp. TaxID=1870904 RepID=UPI0029BB1985|nr:class I SAM-dependent methyltransferase [Shinella sp.]MDX3975034.1 class I SAM-dependent methyltransferase [Shinella sp.]
MSGTERQREIYRRWAPVYDPIYARILRRAHRHLAQVAGRHGGDVLEIGVGTGLGLPYYPSACRVIGIDVSREMLERAKARTARHCLRNVASLQIMDAHHLDFPADTFDVVTLPFVLTLIEAPDVVLRECARVVRPEGLILIASRISRGGPLQTRVERTFEPLARRCGLSAAFHLSRIESWCEAERLAHVDQVENLDLAGFFKLVALRPFGNAALRS